MSRKRYVCENLFIFCIISLSENMSETAFLPSPLQSRRRRFQRIAYIIRWESIKYISNTEKLLEENFFLNYDTCNITKN